jgi:hypothetical protein
MWVAMAYRDNGMSAIEVEVFLSVVVPNATTLSLHNVDVEKRINWIKIHG